MNRKKVISILASFLVLMLLFTVLSRAADSASLANVQTKTAQSMTIDHRVTGNGKVMQNREQAVSTIGDQKVQTIYVSEGQTVEAGELLFDLDIANLKEQILLKKQEIEKMDLTEGDNKSKSSAEEQKKSSTRNRAEQDVGLAAGKGNEAVTRAAEALQNAQQKLQEYRNQQGIPTDGNDAVLAELNKTLKAKDKALQQAQEELKELERKIEREVNKALDAAEKKNQEAQAQAAAYTEPQTEAPAEPSIDEKGLVSNGSAAQPQTQTPAPAPAPETEDLAKVEKAVRDQYKSELEKANKKVEKAQKEKSSAEQAIGQYQQEQAENQAKGTQEQEQLLIDDVNAKQQAYDDAVNARDDSIRTAQRALEDANAPEGTDSSGKISKLDKEKLQMELQKLEALLAAGGQIKAPIKGIVTKIAITTGDKTMDGTAMLLADTTNGSKFVAQVPVDQEKYIAKNDPVVLKPGNNGQPIEGLTVESVKANEENKDMLDVTVKLPADTLEIGTAAEFEVTRTSKSYPTCVPISALHEDNNEKFIYVIQETTSVLGDELKAQKVVVKVLDQNENFAALSDGTITNDQKIITGSDKNISGGSRVRLAEE
ncbi:hypothetical protein [Robinsoniella sp. KNHs210]|uniref:hypothetical protein n=1 Tax=Robinsoniella sp. KNHs210 TaxID=1469950 RepID=UPI000484059A|nr:hypothetical protein [Robinsoniella sp. KNHs210]